MRTYSMRQMYGEALVELGAKDQRVVVLEADLAEATRTELFRQRYPERFFEIGIAEQNMMSIAAGMALSGKVAFVSGLAVFVTMRACEQLRTSVALTRANVKVVGCYGGLCTAENGPTHQCIADLGVTRAIPELKVIAPADAAACRALVFRMVEEEGPVYMRILRDGEPVLYDRQACEQFRIGGGHRLQKGEDVTLVAHGLMVHACRNAASLLSERGVSASVVDMYSLKPLDTELILEEACRTKAVVTVEEHNVYGGLGSAVAEALSLRQPTPLHVIGLDDRFAVSGAHRDLLSRYGLTGEAIAASTLDFLRRTRSSDRRSGT